MQQQTISAEFTLTIDDLREAFRANGMLNATFWSLGWFLAIGLMMGLSGRTESLVPRALAGTPAGSLLNFLLSLAPLVLTFGIIWASMFRILRNLKKPRPASRAVALIGCSLAALLLVVHVVVAQRMGEAAVAAGTQTPFAATVSNLLSVVVWVGIYALIGVGLVAFSRTSIRRIWNGDVTLHRAKRSEVGPTGYTEIDGVSRREDSWLALLETRETPNLFLLYIGRSKFYVVPKRGFADAAAVDAFRAMLRQNVSDRSNAFPVMRAPGPAVPYPLPAPPLPVSALPAAATAPPPLPAMPVPAQQVRVP
jgi:hypothetical protein